MDDYEEIKLIGRGSFGRALLCRRISDDRRVVVKQIDLSDMGEKEREEALNEARVMTSLRHPNIVEYFGHFERGGVLHIVMEHAAGGDLQSLIRARGKSEPARHFRERRILRWTSNIFLSGDYEEAKIGDFGIAKILTDSHRFASTAIGTPYYLSPEICEERPYDAKSDVWALGCVLYELATFRHAFEGTSLPSLVMKITRSEYRPVSSVYSSALRGLVAAMLSRDPRARPSVAEVIHILDVSPALLSEDAPARPPPSPTSSEISAPRRLSAAVPPVSQPQPQQQQQQPRQIRRQPLSARGVREHKPTQMPSYKERLADVAAIYTPRAVSKPARSRSEISLIVSPRRPASAEVPPAPAAARQKAHKGAPGRERERDEHPASVYGAPHAMHVASRARAEEKKADLRMHETKYMNMLRGVKARVSLGDPPFQPSPEPERRRDSAASPAPSADEVYTDNGIVTDYTADEEEQSCCGQREEDGYGDVEYAAVCEDPRSFVAPGPRRGGLCAAAACAAPFSGHCWAPLALRIEELAELEGELGDERFCKFYKFVRHRLMAGERLEDDLRDLIGHRNMQMLEELISAEDELFGPNGCK
eukprot:m51a1_g6735 putative protein serine threonine kinase (592) ;mRNA; f:212566-215004